MEVRLWPRFSKPTSQAEGEQATTEDGATPKPCNIILTNAHHRIHDVRPRVANRKPMVGQQQLHVPVGVLDFLQHALGLDSSIRHLRQLEYLDSCIHYSEHEAGSEENQIRGGPTSARYGRVSRSTAAIQFSCDKPRKQDCGKLSSHHFQKHLGWSFVNKAHRRRHAISGYVLHLERPAIKVIGRQRFSEVIYGGVAFEV